MTPRIPIIIAVWGRKDLTYQTLKSLFECTQEEEGFRVIVIDNNSSQATKSVLLSFAPQIDELVFLKTNLGKPHAWNLGAAIAYQRSLFNEDQHPDKFVFCDNDLEFTPGWLTQMRNTYDAWEDFPLGVLSGWLNEVGRHKVDVQTKSGARLQLRAHPPGCCVMVSRKVVEAIGLFDSSVLIRGVDTAYNRRATAAGFKNGCVYPDSVVKHMGENSRTWNVKTGDLIQHP